MAGIYIHIPFCKKKCHYCNFYSLASVKYRDLFVPALIREIELQKDYPGGEPIRSIYFGGGTPSLLTAIEIEDIIKQVVSFHKIDTKVEITLEANPDDLSEAKIKKLCRTRINRLSIGIQSFFDTDLEYLGRSHNRDQAIMAIQEVKKAGFDNISLDLIYGIPTQSDEMWKDNLRLFLSCDIKHLSAYALTPETGTALPLLIRKGARTGISEDNIARHFQTLLKEMKFGGYEHYEISNFSKPGFYAVHNKNYWTGEKYLGLGPSAHSYDGRSRQWNVCHMNKYIQSITNNIVPFEKEMLSSIQIFNEYVLVSLRTMWGCSIDHIRKEFGERMLESFLTRAEQHIINGNLINKKNSFVLSEKGKLFADGISSDLFAI